eukprot:COSAG06_NODE_4151_length_4523_cov_5.299729_8_plen_99_part_00
MMIAPRPIFTSMSTTRDRDHDRDRCTACRESELTVAAGATGCCRMGCGVSRREKAASRSFRNSTFNKASAGRSYRLVQASRAEAPRARVCQCARVCVW